MERFASQYPDVFAGEKQAFVQNGERMQEAPAELIPKLNAEFEKRKNAILQTESEWQAAPGSVVRYLSASEGDDANTGLSPECAWKSIDRLHRAMEEKTVRDGDVVLLRRGDEWHGNVVLTAGITLSAYGEGAKPRILASVAAGDASLWVPTEIPQIYRFAQTFEIKRDVGNIVFNEGECYGMRVFKAVEKEETLPTGSDCIVSNGIRKWHFPPREFHSYRDLASIAADIPDADLMYYEELETGELFLYSREGNPGDRFRSIDLCTYGHGIRLYADHVVIDNLCVRYTGTHGVGSGSRHDLTVRNCEFGWIGGSIQYIRNGKIVRFGNAVEIYGEADGFYVYNNYIHECFDCGPTAQWSGVLADGQQIVSKDIHFYDNVQCEAALEVWYSSRNEMSDTTFCKLINCRMYNNMVVGSGTGFKAYNHQKFEWCAMFGGGRTNAPYIDCSIEDNFFWNERRHLLKCVPTTTKNGLGFLWQGNIIVHPLDEGSIGQLGEDCANACGPKKQYFYDRETVEMLCKVGAFGFNYFYYTPGNLANRRVMPEELERLAAMGADAK